MDALVDELSSLADRATRAALEAAGTTSIIAGNGGASVNHQRDLPDRVSRVSKAVSHFEPLGDHPYPDVRERAPIYWDQEGDPARKASAWIARVSSRGSEIEERAMLDKIQGMSSEVAGPGASPLERLLADRIAISWAQLSYLDSDYYRRMENGGMELDLAEFLERSRDRAHRRYLAGVGKADNRCRL